jgi:hypothetical protein
MIPLLMAALISQIKSGPVSNGEAFVSAARGTLGQRYEFGGRLRNGEGIDCLGVVLAGAERASHCSWKSYPPFPTKLVDQKLFGAPVSGLSPIGSAALDVSLLQSGDVIMLVASDENSAESAIGQLNGVNVWVWHVGVYSGNGNWIVGDHFAGQSIETNLVGYLLAHADTYSGLFVTRPNGEKPKRCRKSAPLIKRAGL